MPKTFFLAILADTCTAATKNSVLRYTSITAKSHAEACTIAKQIGALVCGWRVVA